jgi:hypothetical protein
MMDDGTLRIVGHGNPIADGRAIDTGELVAQPAGELSEPCLAAEKVIDTSAIGGDASWDETRAGTFQVIELLGEKRSKSEIFKFKFERNQRLLLSEVDDQATSDGAFDARIRPDTRDRESGRCLCANAARSRGFLAGAAVGGSEG